MTQDADKQEELEKQLLETLYQGLQDEMNAAYQYIALAGKYGNGEIKQLFLRYAQEELRHADKLLALLRISIEEVQPIPVVQEEQDDLYLYLIEYMAKEEAAIFYYETLEQLVQEPKLQALCREIRGEEQIHLHQLRALYQRVKETAL